MLRERIFQICILFLSLLLIFLIINCDLKSSQSSGRGNKVVRSVFGKPTDKVDENEGESFAKIPERIIKPLGDDSQGTGDGLEAIHIDVELDNLLDKFNIQKRDKKVIANVKKVLCNPDIVDRWGSVYKTYAAAEFHNLLDSWGADKVIELGEQIFPVLHSFTVLQKLINGINDDIFRQGLLYRLSLVREAYELDLKRIFGNSVYDNMHKDVVRFMDLKHQNDYSQSLEEIKTDALEFVSLINRYAKFSDDGQAAIRAARKIVTDPNIAREQGYRTYSNDEFDILLSSWGNDQIQEFISMYLGYEQRKAEIDLQINSIDSIDDLEASGDIKYRLLISLGRLRRKMRDQFSQKSIDYLAYLKGFFNKSTAIEVYDNVFVASDSFVDNHFSSIVECLSSKRNFVNRYNGLLLNEKVAIEWIRRIVFDSRVAEFERYKQYTDDYEFYLLLGGTNSDFLEIIDEHLKVLDAKEKALQAILNLGLDSSLYSKCLFEYNWVSEEYTVHVKKLFSIVEDNAFEIKFDQAKEKDYKMAFYSVERLTHFY
ncbi:BTA121 domain-containing protein surface lipoprotein [Borrelia persica]|uniref:BTA121 domain-containing protein surface lipoprotein n=1 Tax=Borrelia persica TaxID=44448 RepID=UPI0004674A8B|nr:hypothetical protein [Borrelia persica]